LPSIELPYDSRGKEGNVEGAIDRIIGKERF